LNQWKHLVVDVAQENDGHEEPASTPICPICGGRLIEIRAKLVCERCHAILETCCEGGKQ